MLSVKFYCRACKVNPQGTAPIEMSINCNGDRYQTTVGKRCRPQDFNKIMKSRNNELRLYLTTLEQKVSNIELHLLREGIPLTLYNVKTYLRNGCTTSYTLEQLFNEYLTILDNRVVNHQLTTGVKKKYENVRDYFFQHVDKNMQAADLSQRDIRLFVDWLLANYKSTSAAGMATKLKTVILYGFDNNRLRTNPFSGIKIKKQDEKVQFLTRQEIEKISNKEMPNERLERVKDLFLYACGTGQAFVDIANTRPEDFKINEYGQTYIQKQRQKTKVEYCVVVLPEALEIAKKYNYNLPTLSNQKYNAYLKEIQTICNIDKPLHSHIARHSYASRLLNDYHLSIETVAKCLGDTVKQATHYAKLLDNTVFSAFSNILY